MSEQAQQRESRLNLALALLAILLARWNRAEAEREAERRNEREGETTK